MGKLGLREVSTLHGHQLVHSRAGFKLCLADPEPPAWIAWCHKPSPHPQSWSASPVKKKGRYQSLTRPHWMSRALWTLHILSSALDWHSKSNSSQDSKAGHPGPASFLPLSLLGPGLVTSAFVGLCGEITPQQWSQLDDRQGCSLLVRNGFPWHSEPNLKLFPCFHKTVENLASDLSPTPLLILSQAGEKHFSGSNQ